MTPSDILLGGLVIVGLSVVLVVFGSAYIHRNREDGHHIPVEKEGAS